jgi:hypothetical protein
MDAATMWFRGTLIKRRKVPLRLKPLYVAAFTDGLKAVPFKPEGRRLQS